ncbi:class E basic helix-loop-helix protein 22-like [Cavia porcellus]|uniref:class E basic helix-loop-helix protein 22-like n=1 Tax=Cavia porcellus TaxID=10141 RepID=UPI002FE05B93
MTRPVLVSPPRTPGCCSRGWRTGTRVLSPRGEGRSSPSPGAAHSRRGASPRAPSLLRAAATSACLTFVARRRSGVQGSPARTSPRGHPAPSPTRAAPRRTVRPRNGSAGPGGGGVSLGGQRRLRQWRRDLRRARGRSGGGGGEGTGGGGTGEGGGEGGGRGGREAFSAQTAASSGGHRHGDTPLVAPPLWKGHYHMTEALLQVIFLPVYCHLPSWFHLAENNLCPVIQSCLVSSSDRVLSWEFTREKPSFSPELPELEVPGARALCGCVFRLCVCGREQRRLRPGAGPYPVRLHLQEGGGSTAPPAARETLAGPLKRLLRESCCITEAGGSDIPLKHNGKS